jgi:Bacteriophage HK97-gp10, putative tail-component
MGYSFDRAAADAFANGTGGPVYRIVAQAGARVLSEARSQSSNRKVRVRTGRYVASWNMTMGRTGLGPTATMFNTAPYAIFLELGTKPHPISVKYKKVLFNHETGQFFGTKVFHPGTKARNVLRDALFTASF